MRGYFCGRAIDDINVDFIAIDDITKKYWQ